MQKMMKLTAAAALVVLSLVACKKDDVKTDDPVQKALTARSWRVERVTEFTDGAPSVSYLRGAANNTEDYSLVRQSYKMDGSIQYVGQFGESGSDARYALFDNSRKMRLTYSGLSTVVENLVVNNQAYKYILKVGDGDSIRFEFSPVQ